MGIEVTSSGSVKTTQKFGKLNCCICGKEVGMMGRVQLGDMEEVCRDCAKKAGPFFVPQEASKAVYVEHMKNMPLYQKLYETYFLNNKEVKKTGMGDGKIFINEEAALICFWKKKGGFLFWGGTVYPMVYRIADIESHEVSIKTKTDSEGKVTEEKYLTFFFHKVSGISSISMKSGGGSDAKLIKYLEESMGLRGLQGVKNKVDTMMKNVESIKNIVNGAVEAAQNPDGAEAKAAEAAAEAEKMFYNGREALVEKADKAIAAVQ